MISLEIWTRLTPLQKLPSNVGYWGKIIVATSLELLPKVQKIAQSGHTDRVHSMTSRLCMDSTAMKSWYSPDIDLEY